MQDPFFIDDPSFEHYRVEQPRQGMTLDAFFGFKKPSAWRKRAAPEPAPSDLPHPTYLGVTVTRRRLTVLLSAAGIIAALLGYRALTLQIARGVTFRLRAEGNRIRFVPSPPIRGAISDRGGVLLADNTPETTLAVIPQELGRSRPERERALEVLKTIVGELPSDESERILTASGADALGVHIAKEPLTQEAIVRFTVATNRPPGAFLRVQTRRLISDTARGPAWGNLLGYTGRLSADEYQVRRGAGYLADDYIGKSGIESAFESELHGRPGKIFLEVDNRGRAVGVAAEEPTVPGTHLDLSIDAAAENKLSELLARHARVAGASKAAAVAINPRTGEILALVSLPGFDPDEFARGISQTRYKTLIDDPARPLFPRAIAGTYPSGSTIKPVIAAAALDAGVITPQTVILSTGGISYGDQWFFPDWKPGGHGPTDVYKAIAESVNTFFYTIGGGTQKFSGLGPERIAEAANRFGLGRALGIEMPSEAAGLIPTPQWKLDTRHESWFIGDTYHLAIGQGDVLVTPLQMAVATAAVANGGTVYRPTLRKVDHGEAIEKQAATQEALTVVRAGMRQTVTAGSARSLGDLPIAVAGKTGTAEWKDGARPHAWFIGFAPYDRPTIAFAILVEAAGEGSSVAVPVAREFLGWYFTHKETEL